MAGFEIWSWENMNGITPNGAMACERSRNEMAEVHGNRTIAPNPSETGVAVQSGAESGAVDAADGPIDPDLQAIIQCWPDLPDRVKASVVAMVRRAE